MFKFESNIDETVKYFEGVSKRFSDFSDAKPTIVKIVNRDLEQRKTITPDLGAADDFSQQVGYTSEDIQRAKYWRPVFDYESSPENPILKTIGNNQLTTDASFDTQINVDRQSIDIKVTSNSGRIPNNITTPALEEKVNNYLVDYIMTTETNEINTDKYMS